MRLGRTEHTDKLYAVVEVWWGPEDLEKIMGGGDVTSADDMTSS